MAAFAARMVDHVIPRVPVRQWVLTLPWDLRLLLASRHDLARGGLRVAFRVIQRFYRDRVFDTRRETGALTGSVTVLQRSGCDLRLNPHFHMLVLDDAFLRDDATGAVRFHKTLAPTTADVERIVEEIAARAVAWLRRQGVDDLAEPDPDDLQLALQAASVAGVAALGRRAGRRAHRFHWADLLARIFGVDAFACPRCVGRMTVRAVVLPRPGTLDVLCGLQGAARAPPAEDLPAAWPSRRGPPAPGSQRST